MVNNQSQLDLLTSPTRHLVGYISPATEDIEGNSSTIAPLYPDLTAGDLARALRSFTVSRAGANKFFGFGVGQEITVQWLDPDRIYDIPKGTLLRPHIEERPFSGDGDGLYFPITRFYVTEVTRDEYSNELTIKGVDRLYNARNHTLSELGLTPPYSQRDLVLAIVDFLGIEACMSGELLSSTLTGNYDGTETLREILDDVAETNQAIYYIGHNGDLRFKRLDKTGDSVLTINKADYFTLKNSDNITLSKIVKATALGDNLSVATGGEGVTQYVRDNPFWEMLDDNTMATHLNEALERVGGITATQFDCHWRGNYLLEPGDKISLITKDDKAVNSFYINDKITFDGGLEATTSWEYPIDEEGTESNPATISDKLSQTFAKVDKIEKNITLHVSEIVDEVLPTKIEESIDEATKELMRDIERLDADIAAITTTTSTHTENISQLQVTSTSINNEVSTLKETTTVLRNDLGEVVATQEAIQNDMASLQLTSNQITASVSSVEKKVTTLDTEIDNVSNQANSRIDSLASDVALKLDKTGVEITVDKRLEEGVDKVVTSSKKYSFDDTGLNVSSADSEISTLILEDGMRISKSSQEVLTVNNQGVKAQNLHAYTFLIIGENSRMEDRGNRTACFWIGKAGG